MRRAFVSHSSADDSFVAEMESLLRAAGFDEVFNDVSAIRPDEKFWPEIEKGIANCDNFVVVITAASNSSEWVKREIEHARGLSKKIIPVWIEDCPIPPAFDDRDVIDLRPRTRKERRFDISRIVKYAPAELIGREDETKLLKDAWERVLRLEKGRPHVLTFVALGGEGKTSLVAKWAAELAGKDWPGCDAAFAWSFYSQGTEQKTAASSDLFLKTALNFFGDDADKAFAASPASAFEKGQRLARIVGLRRDLLILDGLEPLQYASTSPMPGELKDQGIAKLLKDLATNSHGLCLVTTRYSLPDLRSFWQTTAPEVKLLRLSRDAGVHLLKTLGVRGTAQEFETLVEDVKGHALTLQIMGGFLKRAFGGDIRQRDRVKLEKADERIEGGHAFRTMAAYEQWLLRDGGDEGQREVAVLRLMGLFDRPADAGCLAALRREPVPRLTKPLARLSEDDWEYCLSGLETAKLLTVNRDASGALISVDAHPLLREYFAKRIRTRNLIAWRAAHRRLYEYLCATTPDKPQPTLEDLQPLYQAVAHGCQAGLQQEACDNVYRVRILRDDINRYTWYQLGAYASELSLLAWFFDEPWTRLAPNIAREEAQAWLLHLVAGCLCALGQLTKALGQARSSAIIALKVAKAQIGERQRSFRWGAVSDVVGEISQLELTLGEVATAITSAEQATAHARLSGNFGVQQTNLTSHAAVLHQAGRCAQAETLFRAAEQMQAERQPSRPLLHSVSGFRYCNLLLAPAERAAWQSIPSRIGSPSGPQRVAEITPFLEACHAVSQRTTQTLQWEEGRLLDVAIDRLNLGRAGLYGAILKQRAAISERPDAAGSPSLKDIGSSASHFTFGASAVAPPLLALCSFQAAHDDLEAAVAGLRRASALEFLVHGLLARAWVRFLSGAPTGHGSAQEDLDEAWEIAERGPMKLHMADIHLYRARLFFREAQYPWESPAADLAAAEKLIDACGYHRRDEELADAKRVIQVSKCS